MKALKYILLLLLVVANQLLFAQGFTIAESAITRNSMAILEISSTTKGMLIPRVTTTEMNAITGTAAVGLTVYNTTVNAFYYNNSTTTTANWVPLLTNSTGTSSTARAWNTTGNASTTAGTDFIGTTDNVAMIFKTNNAEVMRITGSGYVGIGTNSPTYPLTLSGNAIAVGLENGAIIYGKNSGGTYEKAFIPRASDNVMYMNFGTGGMNLRNNAYSSVLFFNSSRNLGINNTSPAEKLDVTGNMEVSGTVYWGESNTRSDRRDNAGLRGDAGARSGFFYTDAPSPASSWPTGASSWWHLLDIRHSNTGNNYALQIAGSYFDQNLYFRKTNDNASTGWTKILKASDLTSNNVTRSIFSSGTTTTFYSDTYIQLRWQSNSSNDIDLYANAGHTGDWSVSNLGENVEGGTTPNSNGYTRNSSGSWTRISYLEASYGPGTTMFITKKDVTNYPVYKVTCLRHGTYKTAIVERIDPPPN
jgi:hypothetical protein